MDTFSNIQWKVELEQIVQEVESRQQQRDVDELVIADLKPEVLATYIDHTILKLDATEAEVEQLCDEAQRFNFAAVCVRLNFVPNAKVKLEGNNIPIACVVGFHEGTQSTQAKIDEASSAIQAGATELDVVLNRDQLAAENFASVYHELHAIREIADGNDKPSQVHLKLIIETSMLDTKQIIEACALAGFAGWDYIKTSTGFCGHGATAEHVRIMKLVADIMVQRVRSKDLQFNQMKVKASGGIRTYQDAITMISAGADRLGASAGVKLMQEAQSRSI